MLKKILFVIFIFTFAVKAQEVLDKIVAVVGDEIILQSEFNFRVELAAAAQRANPKDKKFRRRVLESMVEEKLLYAQAELDSITVSDDQIEQQLNYQINYYINQYGSRQKVEQVYGMSIERIKRELRDDTRKNLMAQMVQNKKFGNIDISRREVKEFFDRYKDSLGVVPEKFEIAHIFINPQKGARVRKKAYEKAKMILDSLKKGADFAELAKKYSDDPGSASKGGDLGYVKRGVFYPQFESAAFKLKKGQLSGIVESPVGFHIIQLLDRRGDEIHTRHILIKIRSDEKADLQAIDFLSNLRDSIKRGVHTFEYYAKKYSDDKQTAPFGGKLGTFDAGQLEKSLLNQLYKLKPGEMTYPTRLDINSTTYGYHIVKLLKHTPEHRPSLSEDYDEIKKIAEIDKKQRLYHQWIKELKKKIYWEIRI